MKRLITVATIVLVIGVVIPLAFWIYNFGGYSVATESKEWAEFGSYLGGVLSPILAFASFVGLLLTLFWQSRWQERQQEWKSSTIFHDNAIQCLERAYAALTSDGLYEEPTTDRLAWLTCARWLTTARRWSGADRIIVESLRRTYLEEEEYWRGQFYLFLDPFNVHGFASNADNFRGLDGDNGESIDSRSIAIIYRFVQWPEGRGDPIDDTPGYSQEEIANFPVRFRGIRDYLTPPEEPEGD